MGKPLWHVVITVAGEPGDQTQLRCGLERLTAERPFVHSVRFSTSAAELKYWEEGGNVIDVAALASRVWWDHRDSCRLPDWDTVGIEVIGRAAFDARQQASMEYVLDLPHEPRPLG